VALVAAVIGAHLVAVRGGRITPAAFRPDRGCAKPGCISMSKSAWFCAHTARFCARAGARRGP
jgi:hypothetical protein